ncbi:hypothetical protein [Streptomyces sp. enrichment culture]|uniref:hypothetical protein n=1 Tax=Streptomyces sp. enrichment culture TaxID=1795815 RepID=UPI003F56B65C
MRRTASALTAAALAGTALGVLGGLAPAASAADPRAEVSPGTARPGGTVTVTVTCAPTGGPAPQTLQAASEAFTGGALTLTRLPGGEDAGPTYEGTATLPDAAHFADAGASDTGTGTAGEVPGPPGGEIPPPDSVPEIPDAEPGAADELLGAFPGIPDAPLEESDESDTFDDFSDDVSADFSDDVPADFAEELSEAPEALSAPGGGVRWTVHGTCPAAPGGKGTPWSVTFTVTVHSGGTPTHTPTRTPAPVPTPCPGHRGSHCGATTAPGGVHAGDGGAFTDSVPALAAGGLLIAGAFGAAAHRVYRDRTAREDG